jgi:hypothetical protein
MPARISFHGRPKGLWSLLLALLLSAAPGRATKAQDAPVVFVHGFRSNGAAWAGTANLLASRLQITPLTPTTPWSDQFATQTTALRDALNTWGRTGTVAFAHSNGGLNARNYVQTLGTGSRINRLVTINSPHGGAPIAANVLNGAVFAYFGNMAAAIGNAVNFYAANDPEWNQGGVLRPIVVSLSQYMQYFGQTLANNSIYVGLGFGAAIPVTQQDVPGSAFVTGLNGRVAVEASVLSARIGVSNDLHPDGALLELVSSSPEQWRRIRGAAMANFALLHDYYENGPDPYLAYYAWLWDQAYLYVAEMDLAWQDYIGAIAAINQYGLVTIYHNDGFIPSTMSLYPGRTLQLNYFQPGAPSIPHTGELDDPFMRARYEDIMRTYFNIPLRPSVPPPYEPPPECIQVHLKIIC